ncbi:D-alanyl-D-alanine carboxypeptidase family protein [Oceanicella actignis]|uniref:D-alanyl-D-alanine carboxypeptidase family protein n=1 Tax=Oceanicella actignis TaxID=1189325 RepID=UPI0011E79434|nr:D-alanyl-D-alanine carboxypeptidase family protein [Oceanicella actignis]TYO88425.1 D-alanyl-D-alanine carboxypeptidase (penicillin-binding protein 5/6) [Oceanicella actignis]
MPDATPRSAASRPPRPSLRPILRPSLRATLSAALFAALALGSAAPSRALDTAARAALVIDAGTGAELLARDPDVPIPPASMSKLMTVYMVFEALAEGRLSMEDRFRVSARAAAMGGSKMFAREGDAIRVADLLRGVIVQSGNDACVVLAEGLAGSEEAFAARMNERARQLGLRGSHFANATGWPDPGQRMTPRDLVTLAQRLIEDFPQYYPIFAETEFTWEGIRQRNRNPLLFADVGADGLKTGHTEEAGYGLVGSARRGDRRVILMIGGLPDAKARALEAERLVKWAFREFVNRKLYAAGQILGEAEVWLGARPSAPLTVARDVVATVPWGARDKLRARIVYEGPLEAPVARGQEVARLVIEAPDMAPIEVPVVAAEAVPEGGFPERFKAAARLVFARAMRALSQAAEDVAGEGAEGAR